MKADNFDLERFVTAQAPVLDDVVNELKSGRKRTHWMWFIFPQLRELGRSTTARFYGIASIDEARSYRHHPLLGSRLILCTRIVLDAPATSLHSLFGSPDDLKFRSCMTLFEAATGGTDPEFGLALDKWCDGERDPVTHGLIMGDS